MRRLLRDIAEGKALGDTTTLADPSVVAKLKTEYEDKEGVAVGSAQLARYRTVFDALSIDEIAVDVEVAAAARCLERAVADELRDLARASRRASWPRRRW